MSQPLVISTNPILMNQLTQQNATTTTNATNNTIYQPQNQPQSVQGVPIITLHPNGSGIIHQGGQTVVTTSQGMPILRPPYGMVSQQGHNMVPIAQGQGVPLAPNSNNIRHINQANIMPFGGPNLVPLAQGNNMVPMNPNQGNEMIPMAGGAQATNLVPIAQSNQSCNVDQSRMSQNNVMPMGQPGQVISNSNFMPLASGTQHIQPLQQITEKQQQPMQQPGQFKTDPQTCMTSATDVTPANTQPLVSPGPPRLSPQQAKDLKKMQSQKPMQLTQNTYGQSTQKGS